jgi:hypothetical protein
MLQEAALLKLRIASQGLGEALWLPHNGGSSHRRMRLEYQSAYAFENDKALDPSVPEAARVAGRPSFSYAVGATQCPYIVSACSHPSRSRRAEQPDTLAPPVLPSELILRTHHSAVKNPQPGPPMGRRSDRNGVEWRNLCSRQRPTFKPQQRKATTSPAGFPTKSLQCGRETSPTFHELRSTSGR